MSNQFEATCSYCKKAVNPGEGVTKKIGRSYSVRHAECVDKVSELKVTRLDDGLWRIKKDKKPT